MPRKRTGGLLWELDHYVARVTIQGRRERIHLPPEMSEARAEETAKFYAANPDKAREKLESQKAQKSGIAPAPKGETFAAYLERWLQDRANRGYAKVSADRLSFAKHVLPLIGEKPMTEIQREDLERIVQAFDEKTARKEWSWATGSRIWLHLRKLFSDACKSKNLAL